MKQRFPGCILSVFAVLLLIESTILSTFSALGAQVLDGILTIDEWSGARSENIIMNTPSNNGVSFAKIYWFVDRQNYILSLAFECSADGLKSDNLLTGVYVSVNDGEYLSCTVEGKTEGYTHENYYFEAACKVRSFNSFACEMEIGVKNGLGSKTELSLRFADAQGELSNVYRVTLYDDTVLPTMIVTAQPPTTDSPSTSERTESHNTTAKTPIVTAKPTEAAKSTRKSPAATTVKKTTTKEKETIAVTSKKVKPTTRAAHISFSDKTIVSITEATAYSATVSVTALAVQESAAYKKKKIAAASFSGLLILVAATAAVIAAGKSITEEQ